MGILRSSLEALADDAEGSLHRSRLPELERVLLPPSILGSVARVERREGLQQIKTSERQLKYLEYQLSRVEELGENFLVQNKLQQGRLQSPPIPLSYPSMSERGMRRFDKLVL